MAMHCLEELLLVLGCVLCSTTPGALAACGASVDVRSSATVSSTGPYPLCRSGVLSCSLPDGGVGAGKPLQMRRWRALTTRPAAAAVRCNLQMRGGLWYDPEEEGDDEAYEYEDEESYYTTTEEADAFDQQAAGGIFSQLPPQVFELPDGRKVEKAAADVPERYGDGMTLEQAGDDTKYCPRGLFSGGRDR